MSRPSAPREDPRLRAAWRTWLSALAVDAEAALAAALAYEALAPAGRDAWLEALDEDAPGIEVPVVALYAPLLAVETDEARRARIVRAITTSGARAPRPEDVRAFRGIGPDGARTCALMSPLYLDFVALLVCRYAPDVGILAARREPLRHLADALGGRPVDERGDASFVLDGVTVSPAPLGLVIEDLAHAIVADRRHGRAAPEALGSYAHLFAPDLAGPGPVPPARAPLPTGP